MRDMNDWDLVARARSGDTAAYAELVRRYQTPIIHFCQRMTNSREDAEEIAQEAFVRVYRHLHRLKEEAKFSTLLFGIARNLASNHLRDSGRRGRGKTMALDDAPPQESNMPSPDAQAQGNEIMGLIERGLARLSEEHREVLILREIQGMDYENIAAVIRCQKGTVKSRLARAREQ
jgi:RNA polymerase sigma-70 factor (ECF subfamily)